MKFYITGSTRGLGESLSKEFDCISFNKPYDLSRDIDTIIEQIEPGSVVILNAYANGSQLHYLNKLKDKCSIIICGSVAAVKPDVSDILGYSLNKLLLEKAATEIALSNKFPILYLRLTNSSYKNHKLVIDTIKFWLANPQFTFAGFNINE
jgi:hypothetical protein